MRTPLLRGLSGRRNASSTREEVKLLRGRHDRLPSFERLEDRTVLSSYVPLGGLGGLGFFSSVAPTINNTTYTFTGSDIQFGYASPDSQADTFVPVYTVNGTITFDQTATPASFNISGTLNTVAPVNNTPAKIWTSSTPTGLLVSDVLGNGASLSGAGTVLVTGVPLQVASVGLAEVNKAPVPALRGNLSFDFNTDSTVDLVVAANSATSYAYVANNVVAMTGAANPVTVDFNVFGLELVVSPSNPLILVFNGPSNAFDMYGSVEARVGNPDNSMSNLTATMGSQSTPGLILSNGVLQTLDLSISGGFSVYLLKFTAQNVGLDYQASNHQFNLFGSASLQLTTGIVGNASLGTEATPGVTIVNGDWNLNAFKASITYIPLGTFALNNLEVNYQTLPDGTIAAGGSGGITFPGNWGTGCVLEFTGGSVNTIGVNVVFTSTGFPLGPTGLVVNSIAGAVTNIDNPSNLGFAGTLSVSYGPEVKVMYQGNEVEATIAAMTGNVFIDTQRLILSGSAYFGAYAVGQNFFSILGQGTGQIDLDWGSGNYSAQVSAELLDSTFTFDAGFDLNTNGSVYIAGQAQMNVPAAVPLIGGENLLGADFVLNWQSVGGPNNGPQGFVSGWTSLLGHDTGIAYNLVTSDADSNNWELIGNSAVQEIEQGDNPFINNQFTYYITVTVPATTTPASPAPISGIFSAVWPDVGGTQSISVKAPNGQTYTPGITSNGASVGSSLAIPVPNTKPGQKSYAMQLYVQSGSLPTGTYTVQITSDVALNLSTAANSTQWTANYSYTQPTIFIRSLRVEATPTATVPLSALVQAGLEGQSSISLYLSDDPNRLLKGELLATIPYATSPSVPIDLSGVRNGTYYLYATINDGFNPQVTSRAATVQVSQPLAGIVTNANSGSPLLGMLVWIHNPNNPVTSNPVQYNPSSDLSTITDANGIYVFSNPAPNTSFTPNTTYYVGVNATPGFTSTSANPTSFVYNTITGAVANFVLSEPTYVQGIVFNDRNNDGVQNNNERPIPGVTVTLSGGTGPITTTTDSQGIYSIAGLAPNTSYTVAVTPRQSSAGKQAVVIWNPGKASSSFTTGSVANAGYTGVAFNLAAAVPVPVTGTVSGYAVGSESKSMPLGGWIVRATGTDANGVAATRTTTSDVNGNYVFTDLLPGTYTLTETVQPGWYEITPVQETQRFAPFAGISLPSGANSTAEADFNHDGYLDLAVGIPNTATGVGTIEVFYGPYPFASAPQTISFGSASTQNGSFSQIVVADVNADGNPDIVAIALVGNDIILTTIFDSPAKGYIGPNSLIQTITPVTNVNGGNPSYLQPTSVVADYDKANGDDFSIVTYLTGGGQGTLYTILNGGNTHPFMLANSSADFGGGLAVGDMNNDGYPDNVYWAKHDEDVNLTVDYISPNSDGILNFNEQWVSYNFSSNDLFANIGLGDINNDGYLDPVFDYSTAGGGDTFGFNFWLNSLSMSTFLATNTAPSGFGPSGTPTSARLAVVDMNGDGLADAVGYRSGGAVVNFNSGGSVGYLAGGDYVIDSNSTYLAGFSVTLSIGDLDGNGLPDLVFLSTGYSGVSYDLNLFVPTASPGFRVQTEVETNAYVVSPSGYTTPGFVNHQFTQINGTTAQVNPGNGPAARPTQASGLVFEDANRNGHRDPNEPGVAGLTVYIDRNHNGRLDKKEPRTVTNAGGLYDLPLRKGEQKWVRVAPTTGWNVGKATSTRRGNLLITDHALTRSLLSPIRDRKVIKGRVVRFVIGQTSQVALREPELRYRLVRGPAKATINAVDGTFTWKVPKHYKGRKSIAVTVEVFNALQPLFRESKTFHLTVVHGR